MSIVVVIRCLCAVWILSSMTCRRLVCHFHATVNANGTSVPFSNPSIRKDAKKVSKLEAQIPYHEGRGDKEAAEKIRQQIEDIWTKTKEAAFAA